MQNHMNVKEVIEKNQVYYCFFKLFSPNTMKKIDQVSTLKYTGT